MPVKRQRLFIGNAYKYMVTPLSDPALSIPPDGLLLSYLYIYSLAKQKTIQHPTIRAEVIMLIILCIIVLRIPCKFSALCSEFQGFFSRWFYISLSKQSSNLWNVTGLGKQALSTHKIWSHCESLKCNNFYLLSVLYLKYSS